MDMQSDRADYIFSLVSFTFSPIGISIGLALDFAIISFSFIVVYLPTASQYTLCPLCRVSGATLSR